MHHDNLHLILGGPGTGKTTRLLQIVEQELERGVLPNEIAFVSFTKVAASEARDRAMKSFGSSFASTEEAPWFRTIHSLAYAQLGITKDEIMSARDWADFTEYSGEQLSIVSPTNARDEFGLQVGGGINGAKHVGDYMMMVIDYAATTNQSISDAWRTLDVSIDAERLRRFVLAFRAFKREISKMDFNDLITRYAHEGNAVPVRVAIIDEAQDLTPAQWRAVERAFSQVERLYVGGDDDQAIYQWAGADVRRFLTLSATPEVLPISYRLPVTVHGVAQQIAAKISERYQKHFSAADREGSVTHHWSLDSVPIDSDGGSWFLLARNSYMLPRIEAVVRQHGFNYATRKGPAVNAEHVASMKLWERLRSLRVTDCSAKEARPLLKLLDLPVPLLKELSRYTLDALMIPSAVQQLPWFEAMRGLSRYARDYYQSMLRRGEDIAKTPRFIIETIHGVKGAQADNVVLLTDISRSASTQHWKTPDTEHRIFYVGATRARHNLHIVSPSSSLYYRV